MRQESLALVNSDPGALTRLESALVGSKHIVVFRISSPDQFKRRLVGDDFNNTTVVIIDDKIPGTGLGKATADKLRAKYGGLKVVSFCKELQSWGNANLLDSSNTTNEEIRRTISEL